MPKRVCCYLDLDRPSGFAVILDCKCVHVYVHLCMHMYTCMCMLCMHM